MPQSPISGVQTADHPPTEGYRLISRASRVENELTSTYAERDRRQHEIAAACRDGLAPMELLEVVSRRLRSAVPFAAGYLSATDPATTLFSSAILLDGVEEAMCAPSIRNEFEVADFNKFSDLHRNRTGATTLRRATWDRLHRSPRHRDVNLPFGFEHELRATLCTVDGCWGVINLLRTKGDADFTDHELDFVDSISRIVGEGLRTSLTKAPPLDQDPHITPGVILLDENGIVLSMTDRAAELVGELGHRPVETGFGVPLPGEAYIVATRAWAKAKGHTGPDPIARVRSRSGGWLTVRGECTRHSDGSIAETAIVIEPSRNSEVLPLFVAAHGLSDREKEVLAELVDGRSTNQIAHVLFISAHTVRDHVKSILEKVGVNSRGELISALYRLHYEPDLKTRHLR